MRKLRHSPNGQDFNSHPDESGRHAAQRNVLGISKMLKDNVSLSSLMSLPQVDDSL